MASKVEAEKVRLECPMCLDNFKNATLLNCGHTFCKECLEKYDEQHNEEYDEQHNDLDHIVCPVCRQSTKLGPRRVSGLTPNFSVKGVEDKLSVDHVDVGGQKASYCTLHCTVYKDILCVNCGIFICLTCYFDTHKDHKIIKKEEVGRNLEEKRDTLIKKSETTKTQIEKCLNDAMQEDKDIHRHLNNLEKNIKDTFVRNVTILQENEELLLKRVDDIRKDSDKQSKRYMTHQRQLIDNINSSMTLLLTDNVSESLDSNTLQAYHLQCRKIENSLKQTIDNESMVHLKQAAERTRFCPADEKLLALGHIEQGVKATASSMQHSMTATGVRLLQLLKASSKVTEIPAAVAQPLKIVRKVELPSVIMGMAVLSQEAVVVGYGQVRLGADCYFVSGDKKPHSEVGRVYDIMLLTNGRSMVSQYDGTCLCYNKQGELIREMEYTGTDGSYHTRLCSDQHDNIYAVNGYSNISIFHGNNMKPMRVVPTGNIKPQQVCVTKTGVMITSTCYSKPSTVAVFDREGHEGTTITASDDDDEYLYAAVDSQDRVLVARVRVGSDKIGLTRYTLQGTTLTEEVTFKPLKLHKPCIHWSYVVSLTPNMIAFAHEFSLYFIEIAA